MAWMMSGTVCRLEVREVRPSLIESLPATVVLTTGVHSHGPSLGLSISNSDAHALVHELAGRATLRRQSLQFATRLADSLGCALQSVRLHSIAPGVIRATVQCSQNGLPIDIPAEACQCLTLAIVNDLPIFYDGELQDDLDQAHAHTEGSLDNCLVEHRDGAFWTHQGAV